MEALTRVVSGCARAVAAAVLVAACAAPRAFAQSDIVRGRPEVPEQKPQHDTRAADEDSLEHLIVDDPVAIPLLDEPGAPVTRSRVPPRYPESARKAGVQGTVRILARIARDGSVARARVTKSIPALDRAALDAVEEWAFVPVTAEGRPVEADVAIPIRFLLPADPAFDWRAGREAGAAAEKAGKTALAFERYLASFRAALAVSTPEAESLRGDLARLGGVLAAKDPAGDGRVAPVEAWVETKNGDGFMQAAGSRGRRVPGEGHGREAMRESTDVRNVDWGAATAAYRRATDVAPWHAPLYRRLATAQERAGDLPGAIRSLELCLAADPRAADRGEIVARLSSLQSRARPDR